MNAAKIPNISNAEAAILHLLAQTAGTQASIRPEDVAKALAEGSGADWHGLLGSIRRAAVRLAGSGQIEILRKGRPIPPESMRGVIRLRLSPVSRVAEEPG